jgi:hypothetical protein
MHEMGRTRGDTDTGQYDDGITHEVQSGQQISFRITRHLRCECGCAVPSKTLYLLFVVD